MPRAAGEEVVGALELNMAAYWLPYGTAPGCRSGDASGIRWLATGLPHPLFNSAPLVMCAGEADAAIDEALAALRSAKAPSMWWLGPSASPPDIRDRLERRGLHQVGSVPGMAVDLSRVDTDRPLPAGFTVAVADGIEGRRTWARVAGLGTGFTPELAEKLAAIETGITDPRYADQPRFIGYENGLPVATAALILDSGVAGIYAVATLARARRKGYGTAVTLAALAEAKRRGYETGILQASEMGYGVYQKMGFEMVCSFDIYA